MKQTLGIYKCLASKGAKMSLIQTVTTWIGQTMYSFDEDKEEKKRNIVSILDVTDGFQKARELLWEIHELKSHADAKDKQLLNDMVNGLKKYGKFTDPQMQMLRNIKARLEQSKMISNASRSLSVEECPQCDSKGMVVAKYKPTGAKFHLRCFCGHADKLSKNIPKWDINYELEYEVL